MPGDTYRAEAFLSAARQLGIHVAIGTDVDQTLPSEGEQALMSLPFANVEQALEKIQAYARRWPIDAVLAVDDGGVVLAASVAQRLSLPHHSVEAATTTRDKARQRSLLKARGVSVPDFFVVDASGSPAEWACAASYPCVLKPLALSGSRGVIRANDEQEFCAAFERITSLLSDPEVKARSGDAGDKVLIEEYVPGPEIALEGLMHDGELQVLALFDKPGPLSGPFFEEGIYVTPSRLDSALREAVVACVRSAAQALGLRSGPVHAEARLGDGQVRLIELAVRSIGGRCSRVLRFAEGHSLETLILANALGMEVSGLEREGQAAGVMMIPIPGRGVFQGVDGVEVAEAIPGIAGLEITLAPGQALVPLPEGHRYLGFIFARGEHPDQVEAALIRAHEALSIRFLRD